MTPQPGARDRKKAPAVAAGNPGARSASRWTCRSSTLAPSPGPATIVPADSKTHRNLIIGTLVRDKLRSLGLRYPPPDPAIKGVKVT